jgi:adenine phosphoribosyltransferase
MEAHFFYEVTLMIEKVKAKIREIKDFPKEGIGFKDIMPLVQDAESFSYVVKRLSDWARDLSPHIITGIESRGFLFAAPVAHVLGLGLTVIRKKGKLPAETLCIRAPNEYAVEHFEMHVDSVQPGRSVVIIDDLIATGSSSICAIDLVKRLGGHVAGFASVVDLTFLKGVEKIRKEHPDVSMLSLIQFDE